MKDINVLHLIKTEKGPLVGLSVGRSARGAGIPAEPVLHTYDSNTPRWLEWNGWTPARTRDQQHRDSTTSIAVTQRHPPPCGTQPNYVDGYCFCVASPDTCSPGWLLPSWPNGIQIKLSVYWVISYAGHNIRSYMGTVSWSIGTLIH